MWLYRGQTTKKSWDREARGGESKLFECLTFWHRRQILARHRAGLEWRLIVSSQDNRNLWTTGFKMDIGLHQGHCHLLKVCIYSVWKLHKMSHLLVKSIDFNAKESLGWTPCMKACINGHKEIVKFLFDHSDSKTINLNAKDIHGRTPFFKIR